MKKRPALWEAEEDAGKAGGHKQQQDGHGGKIRNKKAEKAVAGRLENRLVNGEWPAASIMALSAG